MDLTKYKNRVSDSIFKLLLEKYPTGRTDDKNCPNLLFIVNKKKHVDFLIDELGLNISDINSEGDGLFDRKGLFSDKKDDAIYSYKFWRCLNFLNYDEQYEQMLQKEFYSYSPDILKSHFNENIALQDLVIKRFNFFENIKKYSEFCDVNDVVERFIKRYEKVESRDFKSKFMGETYKHDLIKTLPEVASILNKKNILDLMDLKLYSQSAFFYLYKNDFINEDDLIKRIEKNNALYTYVDKEYMDVLIDKKTGFFKNIFDVYNTQSSNFPFCIAGEVKNYLQHAHPEKINLQDKEGKSVIFYLLSHYIINEECKDDKTDEYISLFLNRGGDINITDNKGETCLSSIKKPVDMLFVITTLEDNGINILDSSYNNLATTITKFIKATEESSEKTLLMNKLIEMEKSLLNASIIHKEESLENKNTKRL